MGINLYKEHKQELMIAIGSALFLILLFALFHHKQRTYPYLFQIQLSEKLINLSGAKNEPAKVLNPQKSVPKLSASQGYGLDNTSSLPKQSTTQINNLREFLPLTRYVQTSSKDKYIIFIAPTHLQPEKWRLHIEIHPVGIFPKPLAKNAQNTKEIMAYVFAWMRTKNINPEQVIFYFGKTDTENNEIIAALDK